MCKSFRVQGMPSFGALQESTGPITCFHNISKVPCIDTHVEVGVGVSYVTSL